MRWHLRPMDQSVDGEDLRYPIGRFRWEQAHGSRREWLTAIGHTPAALRRAVSGLNDQQLDTPYRREGWTVRQVVHHYADDHLNSYLRFKWALTEERPAIKPYAEALWAELPDARRGPIEPSLALLSALHERWLEAWNRLPEEDWHRTFQHPTRGAVSLEQLASLYAWHGQHHVAQIQTLRRQKGWAEELS